MSSIKVFKYHQYKSNIPNIQYYLSISTPTFTQAHDGHPYGYAFEIHDGFLGDANGTARILAEDHELIAEFMHAIKTFCRAKGVLIRIKYEREKYFDSYVSYYFPEFYYGNLHKRIMDHLEHWSDNRIRSVFKRWYNIVRRRKWKRIYDILCQTPIPNDCAYTIMEKVFSHNISK